MSPVIEHAISLLGHVGGEAALLVPYDQAGVWVRCVCVSPSLSRSLVYVRSCRRGGCAVSAVLL